MTDTVLRTAQYELHTAFLAYLEADTEQITLAVLRGTATYITSEDRTEPIADYTGLFKYLRRHLPWKGWTQWTRRVEHPTPTTPGYGQEVGLCWHTTAPPLAVYVLVDNRRHTLCVHRLLDDLIDTTERPR